MTSPLIPSDQLVNMWSDWNPQPDSAMARLLAAAKHALKLEQQLQDFQHRRINVEEEAFRNGEEHGFRAYRQAARHALKLEAELAQLRAKAEAFDLIELHRMDFEQHTDDNGEWVFRVIVMEGNIREQYADAATLTEAVQALAARLDPPAEPESVPNCNCDSAGICLQCASEKLEDVL